MSNDSSTNKGTILGWVSPDHHTDEIGQYEEWSLDAKIEVFAARVDGWHLAIAEQIINGWVDGSRSVPPIKHAGYAVLQICFSYFETIAVYRGKASRNESAHERFTAGLTNVIESIVDNKEEILMDDAITGIDNILWDLRNRIFHADASYGKVGLEAGQPLLSFDRESMSIVINPHDLVPALRKHFNSYVSQLRDPNENEIRKHFEEVFDKENKT